MEIPQIEGQDRWIPEHFENFDKCFYDESLAFINIPKNASSTIRRQFALTDRASFSEYGNHEKVTLAVVRNPLDRIVSSFTEVIKLRQDGPWLETESAPWFRLLETKPVESFNGFLEHIASRLYDSHVHPQSLYITGKGISADDIDHLLVFDDLEAGIMSFAEATDRTAGELLRVNTGSANDLASILRSAIVEEGSLREKIVKIYTEDFVLYEQAQTRSKTAKKIS